VVLRGRRGREEESDERMKGSKEERRKGGKEERRKEERKKGVRSSF